MGKLLSRINYSEHPGRAPPALLASLMLSSAPNCPGEFKPLVLLTGMGKGTQTHPGLPKTGSRFGPVRGNCVVRLLQNQRGCKRTDRSNIPTEQRENQALGISLTPLYFTQDPVIEFPHKPFLLGARGMRRRPEQISENSQFWAPIIR